MTPSEAATDAAETGHLQRLQTLVLRIQLQDKRSDFAWEVLDAAAENGEVRAVQLLWEHAKESSPEYHRNSCPASERSNALNLAVSGGHVDVARVLLTPDRFHWGAEAAFLLAVEGGQQTVVTFMRSFYVAAVHQRITLANFLLETGRVSPKAFDAVFKRVCSSGLLGVVVLLYEKKRASTQSIHRAFVSPTTLEVVKFLYSNEDIFDDCIAKVLKAAVQCDRQSQEGRAGIVEFLFYTQRIHVPAAESLELAASCSNTFVMAFICTGECVSLDLVMKAFTTATKSDSINVVREMWAKTHIRRNALVDGLMIASTGGATQVIDLKTFSSNEVTQVFRNAALTEQQRVAQLFYNKLRMSSTVMNELFQEAAQSGDTKVIALLAEIPCISRSAKNEALMCAASQNWKNIVVSLVDHGYWPRHKLKEALSLARNDHIQEILRSALTTTSHPAC
ncbi:hypothetical protein PHYPSEUDO_012954 [Phytophthora pseudosyringae]|uniref:Ankyrin repeat-containing domain n=1 Tax=Phytophthora pseudosyringae TaxID=221518 RepID=A0A8T1V982_9STRA|nr:hypothetical protein PHYPSEUDO_012954 [Phytophthora pseudosyringae]